MKNKNSSSQFLLIGSGRFARHLEFYFTQAGISFVNWQRQKSLPELTKAISQSSHILLAISDSALESFVQTHLLNSGKTVVHFSGALHIEGTIAAHPLMSFGPHFYKLDDYKKIHFVVTGTESLSKALPGLKNPFTILAKEHKPLYHALCVLGGNFPVILWQKMAEGLQHLGLPEESYQIYTEKVVENFSRYGSQALTGPLVRKDQKTIESNINALKDDPFQKVYKAFVEAYK